MRHFDWYFILLRNRRKVCKISGFLSRDNSINYRSQRWSSPVRSFRSWKVFRQSDFESTLYGTCGAKVVNVWKEVYTPAIALRLKFRRPVVFARFGRQIIWLRLSLIIIAAAAAILRRFSEAARRQITPERSTKLRTIIFIGRPHNCSVIIISLLITIHNVEIIKTALYKLPIYEGI